MNIYLDNASTSFPKPPEVIKSMTDFMFNFGGNSGRGSSSAALKSGHIVYECRENIKEFFSFKRSENVIFTNNITSSINILLNSIVKPDWHIITSSMEHNSVLRPLFKLQKDLGVELTIVDASEDGFISVESIEKAITKKTKLVILSHCSNVVGNMQPLKEIGLVCKKHRIYFIIDSAQTAGAIPMNFEELNCNALAFTGHKSLLGPQGIGGFLIDDELNNIADSVFVGGTGSSSHSLIQPDFLPDKFESGTLNTPGIVGLNSAIKFINKESIDAIHEKEMYLSKIFLDGINNMNFITLYGCRTLSNRLSTFSINMKNLCSNELSYFLDSKYNIVNRTGLHCAPLAHKTIGTDVDGTVRLSIGYFNTEEDIYFLLDALNKLYKEILYEF
ncbi:aminotransferase class V-fold PLP-dependent enzyme [Inconstantimicrobium mannanitabidum]|uniref:Cysteine desulfurase n=1 Tax=Inconstantimicrobium mannanitabidum TaxID=1604901 RepID=A0ACB5RHB1_9CLOT|nr:aminotransferase class V-fold PLP-dependent enzyme [Clostridium sp. TW13]GKX68452.1 cysteine desulfurase [Clostridium sp. TW13]